MTSLFDTPNDGEKKRSIFDSEWTNPEAGNEVELNARLTPLAPLVLVCGILTLFQLIWPHYILTLISGLVILISAAALWQIARSENTLTGKRLIYAGLFLTLLSSIASPVSEYFYTQKLVRQGRDFAQLVINAAQKGDATTLELLQHPYTSRPEVQDEAAYWKSVMGIYVDKHTQLHSKLLDQPVILALYGLGERAQVRFYKMLAPALSLDNRTMLPLTYSVTYDGTDGKPETFFFQLTLNHYKMDNGTGIWKWETFSDGAQKLPN